MAKTRVTETHRCLQTRTFRFQQQEIGWLLWCACKSHHRRYHPEHPRSGLARLALSDSWKGRASSNISPRKYFHLYYNNALLIHSFYWRSPFPLAQVTRLIMPHLCFKAVAWFVLALGLDVTAAQRNTCSAGVASDIANCIHMARRTYALPYCSSVLAISTPTSTTTTTTLEYYINSACSFEC